MQFRILDIQKAICNFTVDINFVTVYLFCQVAISVLYDKKFLAKPAGSQPVTDDTNRWAMWPPSVPYLPNFNRPTFHTKVSLSTHSAPALPTRTKPQQQQHTTQHSRRDLVRTRCAGVVFLRNCFFVHSRDHSSEVSRWTIHHAEVKVEALAHCYHSIVTCICQLCMCKLKQRHTCTWHGLVSMHKTSRWRR